MTGQEAGVPRIDAHQHFWRLARGDYGWLTPALGSIHRDFLPDDLAPLIAAAGIGRTILVQAAPSEAETLFMLDLARETAFIAGVVGWTDFSAPGAGDAVARLAADPLLVGLRPMLQDIAETDWVLRRECAPAFEAMIRHDLVFDALIQPRHLGVIREIARRWPMLSIIVDHGAKPEIAAGRLDPWREGIAALAACPNVACKLSGLVTEAGAAWDVAKLAPYADHLIACFGADRLLFGSDWPVSTLAATYSEWLDAAGVLAAPLGAAGRAALFGGNAARLYLSKRGKPPC